MTTEEKLARLRALVEEILIGSETTRDQAADLGHLICKLADADERRPLGALHDELLRMSDPSATVAS